MAENDDRPAPSLRASWNNLKQPGPLGWKVRRTLANNMTKLLHRQSCCGHPGEPGC